MKVKWNHLLISRVVLHHLMYAFIIRCEVESVFVDALDNISSFKIRMSYI